jgi:hypothetical protein
MRVAFFHGLESPAKSEKNTALDSIFDFVYAPPMPYTKGSLFDTVLAEVKKNKIDLLIGSSMGGYFAYCISTLTGIPTLLFNPAMQGRSFEPKTRMGSISSNHLVVFGKNDPVIDPIKTREYFNNEGVGTFTYNEENVEHRIPISVFKKWLTLASKITPTNESTMKLKYFEATNSINEEWATDAPGIGADYSFLPEEVVQTLIPNFLTARPPVGNLTVEDENELWTILSAQECLTEEDYQFIKAANDSPPAVFYQWLTLRGQRVSMSEIQDMWKDPSNIKTVDAIKKAYKRARPYEKFPEVHLAPGIKTDDYSFPSGHACGAYYIASKLSDKFPHLSDGLYHLASRIAKTRIQAGVHYPSDVEAGRRIGISLAGK